MEGAFNQKRDKMLRECLNSLQTYAEVVQLHMPDQEKTIQRNIIKKVAKEYYDTETTYANAKAALELTAEHFNNDENDCTEIVTDVYKQKLEAHIQEITPFTEHQIWKSLKKHVETVQSENGEAGPSHSDSLVCSNSFQIPTDPLTKKTIQIPYKNKTCGHLYEHESITQYLNSRKGKNTRCPYVGCTNSSVTLADIMRDEELEQLVNQLDREL